MAYWALRMRSRSAIPDLFPWTTGAPAYERRFFYPPLAGTDLPNFPERDWWQPFLGGMRMYAQVGDKRDFESWKQAIRAGRVMVTSGPMIGLSVNEQPVGSVIHLDKPGEIRLEGRLESPQGITQLELI